MGDAAVIEALGELLGDPELAARLAEDVRPERVRARAAIASASEPACTLIVRGAVKLVKERIVLDVVRAPCLARCDPGTGEPWDVIALRTCAVVRLNTERLLEAAPAALARLEAERATAFAERLTCRAAGTVEQRLERLLSDLSRRYGERVGTGQFIALPLRRHELASLVGATTETVSRVFAAWRR
ncbi:MAG TPA: helix-turn-helix domain-containing protein, partial [Polyangiaceae bacterium]|nr:helix-turn-helix domain-containing protein [Polyangiaceae bacterium]